LSTATKPSSSPPAPVATPRSGWAKPVHFRRQLSCRDSRATACLSVGIDASLKRRGDLHCETRGRDGKRAPAFLAEDQASGFQILVRDCPINQLIARIVRKADRDLETDHILMPDIMPDKL